MYLHKKRHTKPSKKRCSRKNAKLKAKNRNRKLRRSGLKH